MYEFMKIMFTRVVLYNMGSHLRFFISKIRPDWCSIKAENEKIFGRDIDRFYNSSILFFLPARHNLLGNFQWNCRICMSLSVWL